MKTAIIVQARMSSVRLFGKILKEVLGKPLLWYLVQRLRQCQKISQIIIATSDTPEDDVVEEFCKTNGIDCFRGSEGDVLDRYYQCAKSIKAESIVRVTGDCPLIDPKYVDDLVSFYEENPNFDLVKTDPTYPEGFDAEICSFENLETTWKEAKLKSEREHVTVFLWKNDKRFKIKWLPFEKDYSFLRLTVDEPVDFDVVKEIIERLYPEKGAAFNFEDIFALYKEKPEIFQKNKHVVRNEGYLKSLEQD